MYAYDVESKTIIAMYACLMIWPNISCYVSEINSFAVVLYVTLWSIIAMRKLFLSFSLMVWRGRPNFYQRYVLFHCTHLFLYSNHCTLTSLCLDTKHWFHGNLICRLYKVQFFVCKIQEHFLTTAISFPRNTERNPHKVIISKADLQYLKSDFILFYTDSRWLYTRLWLTYALQYLSCGCPI